MVRFPRTIAIISWLVLAFCQPLQAASTWDGLKHLAGDLADPLAERESWEGRDVHYYQSALTPGILLRMKSATIRFFSDLDKYDAESPSFLVVKTSVGTKSIEVGKSIDGTEMTAPWIVASFQGCKGWEQFDAPWFIALQNRPSRIALTKDGLLIEFSQKDTGHIFSMPLFGYYKPPQEDNDFAARHNLPSKGLRPWEWKDSLPKDVVERCDWWARVARAYPVGFQESFSVDPARDEITFRQDYRWLFTEDDWGTRSLRFATLSPSLGLAWKYPGFPMSISVPIYDPDYFTPFGPYVGVLNTDRLEITMHVLQYTNELEWLEPPAELNREQREALDLVVQGMGDKFRESWRYDYDHGSRENFCWNIVGDVWYPRGLPFVREDLRKKAESALRVYISNDVLRPHTPFRGKYVLHGPGVGSWGGWDDAGKFMTNTLQAIWAYGQFSADWELIRERWDLIKKFFITPEEAGWIMYGRSSIAEMGDEAPPCSAYARMAWAVGDKDEYLQGVYMFARELVHHYVKQRAGRYFFEHQPYNQYDPMPEHIYPTNVWGSTRGWQVDGPTWCKQPSGEHQSANRWIRFHDPDTGRFYRDHLSADVQTELNWYGQAALNNRKEVFRIRQYQEWIRRDLPHALPSLARLRSFLLGEDHSKLEETVSLNSYDRNWPAASIALGYSYLRSTVDVRHARLIPKDLDASPFVLGLERRGFQDHLNTVQAIWERGLFVEPRWKGWRMRDNSDRSFGSTVGSFTGGMTGAQGNRWLSYGCRVRWADSISPK